MDKSLRRSSISWINAEWACFDWPADALVFIPDQRIDAWNWVLADTSAKSWTPDFSLNAIDILDAIFFLTVAWIRILDVSWEARDGFALTRAGVFIPKEFGVEAYWGWFALTPTSWIGVVDVIGIDSLAVTALQALALTGVVVVVRKRTSATIAVSCILNNSEDDSSWRALVQVGDSHFENISTTANVVQCKFIDLSPVASWHKGSSIKVCVKYIIGCYVKSCRSRAISVENWLELSLIVIGPWSRSTFPEPLSSIANIVGVIGCVIGLNCDRWAEGISDDGVGCAGTQEHCLLDSQQAKEAEDD